MSPNHVAWLDLSEGAALAERLDAVLEDEGPRVVVLDASHGIGAAALAAHPDISGHPLPVVFVFESSLSGPASEVALAADIRIAGAKAALAGPLRSTRRLRTLTRGQPEAAAWFDGIDPVPAERLLKAGLVNSVTQPGEAHLEARRVADVIASRGPIATRLAKEAIWRGLPQPLEQALRFETDLTLLLQTTKDRAEGVRAFLEKRQPVFKGE